MDLSLADDGLQIIIEKTLRERGLDLRQYKISFLKRRLDIRLRVRGLQDYLQYASTLDQDPAEYSAFFDALSINVTEFFRDRDVFDTFAEYIIPDLLAGIENRSEIRIWSAGCATGEEAYTIAILLYEALKELDSVTFKVIGTDISAKAINAAKQGKYQSPTLKNLPKQFFTKYFCPSSDGRYHQICDEIRNVVNFYVGDLTKFQPPSYLDAIFCRNVLIYIEKGMQHDLLTKFYHSLRKPGFLILGKAEAIIGKPSELFEPIMTKDRIYRRL